MQSASVHILLDKSHDQWNYVWGSEKYTSQRYYRFCFREITPHIAFSWIWKAKIIPRIKFFSWLLLSGRLNTRNMLRRRQFNISNTFDCSMCAANREETVEHLFFGCAFSQSCWNCLNFPISYTSNENRLHLLSHSREKWKKKLFMDVFAIASWNIWKERNNLDFNGVTPKLSSWKARFKEDFLLLVHRTKEEDHPFIRSLVASL